MTEQEVSGYAYLSWMSLEGLSFIIREMEQMAREDTEMESLVRRLKGVFVGFHIGYEANSLLRGDDA
jgi:hypothetical protein